MAKLSRDARAETHAQQVSPLLLHLAPQRSSSLFVGPDDSAGLDEY